MLVRCGCAARANVIGRQHQPRARDVFVVVKSCLVSLDLKSFSSFDHVCDQGRLNLYSTKSKSALGMIYIESKPDHGVFAFCLEMPGIAIMRWLRAGFAWGKATGYTESGSQSANDIDKQCTIRSIPAYESARSLDAVPGPLTTPF